MVEHLGLRSITAATLGLGMALLTQGTSAAHTASLSSGNVATQYSFAQSSLSGGGFENVIAADPFHPGVVISGSDVGGIYRSTDYGVMWSAAQSGSLLQTGNPIASIVFDPKTPNLVYAAADSGVAVSTDDGVTWTALPTEVQGTEPATAPTFNGSNSSNPSGTTGQERCVGNLLAVDDSTKPARIYAASFDDGLWMYNATTSNPDDGTWSLVASQSLLGNAFCLTSLAWGSAGALDVSTWEGTRGIYTISRPSTSDPDVQPVTDAPTTVQELVGLTNGHVWGAAYGSGVGLITSSGWVTRLPDTVADVDYLSIAGYVDAGSDVVIAGSDYPPANGPSPRAVLEETKNSGTNWTALPTSESEVSTELLGPAPGNLWWHGLPYPPALLYSNSMVPSSIAIEHQKKGDDIWVAGYGGNWRLLGAQGQSTFYPSDYGIGSTVNHQIAIDPTTVGNPRSTQRVYVGDTDWGMFSSADGFSTQQGISDDQFTGGGTDVLDTVVDGSPSPPLVYIGVGNRNSNTQGELLYAQAPAISAGAFQPLELPAATDGGRPLAVGVVDSSGTATLFVAVEASGMWTTVVGSGTWVQNTSLFTQDLTLDPNAAIATADGVVYAYYPQRGLYRSVDDGATWTEIWANPSVAYAPSLMVDSANPTTLWVTAAGGLYELADAPTATYTSPNPVIAGNALHEPELSGLAELNGQVFTTELGSDGLEVLVSDPTQATFTDVSNGTLSGTQAIVSGLAVANDGTAYISTAGEGVIVGTPVDPTSTTLTSSPNPSGPGQRVTFSATVTATAIGDTPSGSVAFWNGTKKLGTASLNASGMASFSIKTLKKGTYSIVAKYQGTTTGDDPSTSNTVIQKVT